MITIINSSNSTSIVKVIRRHRGQRILNKTVNTFRRRAKGICQEASKKYQLDLLHIKYIIIEVKTLVDGFNS
jgi:hypothetical protein